MKPAEYSGLMLREADLPLATEAGQHELRNGGWSACFAPHAAHALADIDLRLRSRRGAFCLTRDGPAHAVEVMGQGRGDEAAAPGKDMPVAGAGLLMGIEALRHNQVQLILRPGHGHVKEAALLFDLVGRAGSKVGRNAAIDHIQDGDRLPFLTFRRMNGREDQIILI